MIRLSDQNYWVQEAVLYAVTTELTTGKYPSMPDEIKDLVSEGVIEGKITDRVKNHSIVTTKKVLSEIHDPYKQAFRKVSQKYEQIIQGSVSEACFSRGICIFLHEALSDLLPDKLPLRHFYLLTLSTSYMESIRQDVIDLIDPSVDPKGMYWYHPGALEPRASLCTELAKMVCPYCGTITNHFPYCPTI